GPFLIGDFSDTPHGGAYGDAPNLLVKMLQHGVKNAAFGPIWDPEVIEQAMKSEIGAEIKILLGGHSDPEHGGKPFETTATVKAVSETGNFQHKGSFNHAMPGSIGRSACLNIRGIDVIVTDLPQAIYDREQFRLFGVQPEQKDLLVIKAYNHFRADFEPIGRGLVYADSGGIFNFDFSRFNYKKVQRPLWPLDEFDNHREATLAARSNP
ncbi:MAG: microcystin degradation protein MlrC, partial [Bacteroidetes bacterium]|nr:microcystin degradation protein MlrC [Bacteroidota bacterium]